MNLATSSSEQPGQLQTESQGSNLSGADSFAAALAREVEQESGDTDDNKTKGEPGESRNKAKPKSLNDLAERLGIEASELYEIAVPAGSGQEAMTLGQLKDRYQTWGTLEADRLAFTESQVQHQAQIEQGKQELRELMSMIPRDKLNTEVLQRVAARVAERNRALDAQVVEAIPEWKDAEKRTAEMGELSKMLASYGLQPAEVKAIRDPRMLRFIRDAHRRAEQVRKALEAVKPAARKPSQPSGGTGAPRKPGNEPRNSLRPQSGRERFSELLRQES